MRNLGQWYRSGLWTARALGCLVNTMVLAFIISIGARIAQWTFALVWRLFGPFSLLELLVAGIFTVVAWVYIIRRWHYYKETANEREFSKQRLIKQMRNKP